MPENSFANTYSLHREFLEFNVSQHKKLSKFCKKKNIKYATSIWELISAKDIINSKIEMDFIKVPQLVI